jgi:glucosyl-dolichyl phosphate glucuronosyltransferase
MVQISVILCTYNRCEALAKALESVGGSVLPESVGWEVLIVDNHSTDRTRDVAAEFCRRYPDHFRYVFEPRQGKSHALNTGIAEARGTVLAFMDDDVIVEPTWLKNLTAPLLSGEWIGSGGRVLRDWTSQPPPWLAIEGRYQKMAWPLVSSDFGSEPTELKLPPCGTNMAFRREVFETYGCFRTDLGPQGNEVRDGSEPTPQAERTPRCCEDSEFVQRLLDSGKRLRYEPSAVVYHPVVEARLTKGYFLRWWFDFGRGNARKRERPPVWGISGNSFRLVRSAIVIVARALAWSTALTPHRRFYFKVLVWESAGAIFEDYLRLSNLATNSIRSS